MYDIVVRYGFRTHLSGHLRQDAVPALQEIHRESLCWYVYGSGKSEGEALCFGLRTLDAMPQDFPMFFASRPGLRTGRESSRCSRVDL